jgi:hypothetical protein
LQSQIDVRVRVEFLKSFKLIWPVQIPPKKYFPFPRKQISRICETVSPTEGRIAIVTNAGWDAVDAAASGALVVAGRIGQVRERTIGRAGRRALQRLSSKLRTAAHGRPRR